MSSSTNSHYTFQGSNQDILRSSIKSAIDDILSRPESISHITSKVEKSLGNPTKTIPKPTQASDNTKISLSEVKQALLEVLNTQESEQVVYESTPYTTLSSRTPKRVYYETQPETYYTTPKRSHLTPVRKTYNSTYYPSSSRYGDYYDSDYYYNGSSSRYRDRDWDDYDSGLGKYYYDYSGYLDDYSYQPYSRYDTWKRRDYVDNVYDKYLDYKYGKNWDWKYRHPYYY